jgi:hypothetical protein
MTVISKRGLRQFRKDGLDGDDVPQNMTSNTRGSMAGSASAIGFPPPGKSLGSGARTYPLQIAEP